MDMNFPFYHTQLIHHIIVIQGHRSIISRDDHTSIGPCKSLSKHIHICKNSYPVGFIYIESRPNMARYCGSECQAINKRSAFANPCIKEMLNAGSTWHLE